MLKKCENCYIIIFFHNVGEYRKGFVILVEFSLSVKIMRSFYNRYRRTEIVLSLKNLNNKKFSTEC